MIALLALLGLLGAFAGWAVYDFVVSIRLLPGQHTASMYIKNWVKSAKWHRLLLAAALTDGFLYLMLHLILQIV